MKTDKEYHPLPENLFIDVSRIDGQGLFTSEPIFKDTVLGVSHIEIAEQEKFNLFDVPCNLIRTPLGGFINHSGKPNCVIRKVPETKIHILISIKNISSGDELVVDYNDNECGKGQLSAINCCDDKEKKKDDLPF